MSGGSQETMTDPGPETTALIERGGPGTDRDGDEEVGDDDGAKGDHLRIYRRCKGCPTFPNRMNFRKSSERRGGHFQSKNLYCKIWTFKQGFLTMKMIQKNLFRVCFHPITMLNICATCISWEIGS